VANSRSARKRIRTNERKHIRNRGVRSAVRTSITKARRALLGNLPTVDSQEQVLAAVRALDRAAEKGILHRNNAARRKSRLMAMAHKLVTAAEAGDEAAARAAAVGGEKGRARARGKAAAKPTTKATAAKAPARAAAAKATTATKAGTGRTAGSKTAKS
jgi:small subunit ribosomal protein S20